MNRVERQHFVPAFYLAQWATPAERQGKLMVFDRSNGRRWPSTPDGVAFVRDFYTLTSRDAPQAVEDALSKLEGLGAEAIGALTSKNALPPVHDSRKLLAFVAMQAARTQRVRMNVAKFYSDSHMLALTMFVDDAEAFAAHARLEEPDITDADVDKLRQECRALLGKPSTRVDMDQDTLIFDTLEMAATIEDILIERPWQLFVSDSDEQFITSDDPVVLDFIPGVTRSFLNSPGFGRRDTIVSFVLGPRHVLVSRDGQSGDTREFTRAEVATYNTRAVWNAVRFVHYGTRGFEFLGPDDSVMAGPTELLRIPEPVGSSRA